MKLLIKKALRDVFASRGRMIITFLAIILGTTAFGTFTFVQNMISENIQTVFTASAPASASMLVSRVDNELLHLLDSNASIAEYEIGATYSLTTQSESGQIKTLQLFSSADFSARQINKITSVDGSFAPGDGEVLLESDALSVAGLKMGDSLEIILPNGSSSEFTISGLVNDLSQHPPSMHNEVYAYVSADALGDMGLGMNRIDYMVASDSYDRAHILDVTGTLAQVLESSGYQVEAVSISDTPGVSMHLEEYEGALFVLQVFSVVAFLFGCMIISSLFSTILSAQVRQIGILKAIGGLRSDIVKAYIGAALLLILVNIAIAFPLSILCARGLAIFFMSIGNLYMQSFAIPSLLLVIFFAASLLVPLVLAFLPIKKGLAITVKKALNDTNISSTQQRNVFSRLATGKLSLPARYSIYSVTGNRRRFLMNVSMLTLGGLMFVAIMGTTISINTALTDSLGAQKFDYQIISSSYVTDELIDEILEDAPNVEQFEVWNTSSGNLIYLDGNMGNLYGITALEYNTGFYAPALTEGRWLEDGDYNAIVVSYKFLEQEPEYALGSSVLFQIGGVTNNFKIVGVVKEIGESSIYINRSDFAQLVPQEAMRSCINIITSQVQGRQSVKYTAITDYISEYGIPILQAESASDKYSVLSSHYSTTLASLLVAAFMAVIVAGFGLAATMRVQVSQRHREIGILKSIGADSKKIFSMFSFESAFICLFSFSLCMLLCIPVSLLAAYVMGNVILQIPLALSPLAIAISLIIWLLLILFVGKRAGKASAKRAASFTVKEALMSV